MKKVKPTKQPAQPRALDDHDLELVTGGSDPASGQATGKRAHKPVVFTTYY